MDSTLFISYHFPPQGGAGVQRSIKFAKLLPLFDVKPTILTTSIDRPRTAESWTPYDQTMLTEVPDTVNVLRVAWPSDELEYDRVFDSIDLSKFNSVFVTLSPFSDALLAASIARKIGKPWIADLRDPWALDEFQVHRSFWHRRVEVRKMLNALSSASHIIMNTPEAVQKFRNALPELSDTPVTPITNGYDADDFKTWHQKIENDKFSIVHSGFLHTKSGLRQRRRRIEYLLLGRTVEGMQSLTRSHFYLMQAIERFLKFVPSARKETRLTLAGALNDTDLEVVHRSDAKDIVDTPGYLNHNDSVSLIRNADLLFFPMHRLAPGHRSSIVPGKAYEYMATGKPILAAVPEGDAKDFLKKYGAAFLCGPDDVDAMAQILSERYNAWKKDTQCPVPNWEFIQRFERKNLTRMLAEVINSVVACRS